MAYLLGLAGSVIMFCLLIPVMWIGVMAGRQAELALGNEKVQGITCGVSIGALVVLALAHLLFLLFCGPNWFGIPSYDGFVIGAAILAGGGVGLTLAVTLTPD